MGPVPELYATLGVSRSATQEEIRQAFRQLSRRFHPDVNADSTAEAEFRYVAAAHETLNDPAQRAAYDASLSKDGLPFVATFVTSHRQIRRLKEPQIVDCLFEIRALEIDSLVEPPLNVCLAIDRSTSMQGPRLDAVKGAAEQIINSLRPDDTFSVITFSDRAEVVLPARPGANKAASISKVSTIRAQGGTEILQGLLAGLTEMQTSLTPNSVNHLVLLTDGRTYGDEDDCLLLATLAFGDGITISGLGIGDEWNDGFLDRLAAATGGASQYIASPTVVQQLLTEQVRGLGGTIAQRLRLYVTCDAGVTLEKAFRVSPNAQPIPLDDIHLLRPGSLLRNGTVAVLLRFLVHPDESDRDTRPLARLGLRADVPGLGGYDGRQVVDVAASLTDEPITTLPPLAILNALDKLTLYELQEKAWASAEAGDTTSAARRLEKLASRLAATGETELAGAALAEADRLNLTRKLSAEGRKRIKYGTRALIAPKSSV